MPRVEVKDPPIDIALSFSGRNFIANVAHRGYTTLIWMEFPGPNPKRCHQHTGNRSVRDPVYKLVEVMIYTRLRASLWLHYVLHGSRVGRATGTAIMELKLTQ